MDLRQWINDNVLSFSREEIIDPVPMHSVRKRRKLAVEFSRRFKVKPAEPTVCRTYVETGPGEWRPYKGQAGNGTIIWKTGDPRAREESTTRAVIRHWKQWRGERVMWASYLRVGERSGAHIMSAGGEVEAIARPPCECEPPEMIRGFTPGANGMLVDVMRAHPDRATWDEWATMIRHVRLFIQKERDANKVRIVNSQDFGRCRDCGEWARDDDEIWRCVHGIWFCPRCYKRYDMRRR